MSEAHRLPASRRVTALEVGSIFADRYEILAELGRGGMGSVYRARHVGLARQVALKVLASSKVPDADARFAREARAIARLEHPGCVRVLDHGSAGRLQYIAMELLDGQTLGRRIAAGRLAPAEAIDVTRQLLHALAHAHALGVIHRDIKPENVMLVRRRTRAVTQPGIGGLRATRPAVDDATTGRQRAVLIDFGLASLADEQPLTQRGMCVGSPSYLAPERLLGHPHDARTDLYAIGVMLYEMLAGERPFAGTSPRETMQHALHRPPRPLRAVRPDVPAPLDLLVQRALAKDPARRFTDAEDMLLALADAEAASVAASSSTAADSASLASLALAAHEARDDAGASSTIAQLAIWRPSWITRAWAWLRYGSWRWRGA